MRVFRKHLLSCILIALFGGNEATEFFPYEDALTRDASLSQDDASVDYRLPTSVRPISYEIMFTPEFQNSFTFGGIEKIMAVAEEDTDTITLHVGDIKIISRSVILNEKNIYKSSSYDNVTEKYTITLSKTLKKDSKIMITFTYQGKLRDDMIGFYKSSYFDQDGQIKWLAATQFQTTHARHAFACFDEPSFKATFTIRILRNKSYTCLSNMQQIENDPQEHDMVWDTFQQTVPMSTYLVAFVVSEFSHFGQVPHQMWARPAVIDQAGYAHKISKITLELLGRKFLQKYNLPKMDMVAVPDFNAGAMENWGLVTFRELNMLYDEEESSAPAQQKVAFTIAHECSHMWFGNLVTPEWWSYLWLSEGFANYFEYFVTAEIEISWNIKEQFVVDVHQAALVADSLESSQPMTREVSNHSQIEKIGDIITYSKGASIIRMTSLAFKKNVFPSALREYLSKNKEKGLGNPDALWAALQDQVNLEDPSLKTVPVKTVMDTWTTKAGYPVVSVAIDDKGVLHVSQERFFLRNLDNISTGDTWWVPLTWTTQSTRNFDDTTAKYWLSNINDTVNLNVDSNEWVIFNVQSSGFYRVNYNLKGWQLIFNVLHSSKFYDIHVSNRAVLVDDLLNLGRAGYQNYETVLDGITYLKWETNYLPFRAALNGLSYLNKRFGGYEEHSLLKQYVLSLINNTRNQLGYEDREDDDRLTVLLRRDLNIWACNFDDDECVTTYVGKFQKWKAEPSTSIKPNERTVAYCVGIRNGTSGDWEFLWEKYFYSDNAAEQKEIINALGCSLNTTILEKYLKYAISDYQTNRIRKQDSASVFDAVSSSMIGAEYILDFVEKYHEDMEKYYGGLSTVGQILDGASQSFSTQKLVDKFQNFIDRHKIKFEPVLKSLETSLRNAKYELQWYKTYSEPIIQWLRKRNNNDEVTELPVSSSTSRFDEDLMKYRLPKTVIPHKYVITITTHFKDDFTFDGNVLISVTVKEQTDLVVLHSTVLEIHSVKVKAGQEEIKTEHNPVNKYEFLEIKLDREINAETDLTIEISYKGALASDLNGFYKSYYLNNKGSMSWLAATQLEPVFARRMFPCFDEPALKATFTIRVCTERGTYDAISNMNFSRLEKSDECPSNYSVFEESVKMSTYLVALLVSDFKSTKKVENKYAVYARPNAVDQAEYALSVISPIVKFFETNFKQKYQIDKLDMVALPDFQMSAMENWGLLTYREGSLLYDENHSSITSKQAIRNVIAHEIAHQWFGNLVTPAWWNYLWLSEGFGRYFQYHATADVFKDVTLESQFVVDHLHSAFAADSSDSTHPMTHDVFTPSEIQDMFDTISYAKAASVLRMVEKSFGKQVFYNALKGYLNDRKYNFSTPEDLYVQLQTQVHLEGGEENIQKILDTWTTQSGYPVIHVTTQDDIMIFRQERFLFKKPENFFDGNIWHIPITIAHTDKEDYQIATPSFWLTKEQMKIPKPEMLIVNVQQSGFYRVNYDEEHWLRLIEVLKTSNIIHEINRAAIIDDLMNLARANYVNYGIAISATKYLTEERNYLPWRAFYNNLPYLNRRFWGRDIEALYKKYLELLIEPLYTDLTFEDNENNENDLTRMQNMLRIYTREWACKLDIADCKFHAAKYFQLKRNNLQEIPPNYRGVIYCTAMKTDTTEFTYKFLQTEYKRSNVMADKLMILNSLGCSQNKEILEKLLLTAIEENSFIRLQDSTKVFSSVYDASLIGVDVVMNVIMNNTNYDNMTKRFGGTKEIYSIVSALASRLSTYELYGTYVKLLDYLIDKDPTFKNSADSHVANAQYEFDWYERKMPEIFQALDKLLVGEKFRLPNTMYPELYNISLTPYIQEGTFEGNVQIRIKTDKTLTAVSDILLNSYNLTIKNVMVYVITPAIMNDEYDVKVKDVSSKFVLNPITQQLKIYLNEFVNVETLIVNIEYEGTLNDNMQGFYRSSYKDKDGVLRWLATTQFEPAHARQAFPCFDEPAFKSKFIINIQRPTFYTSLSNMPRSKELASEKAGYMWDIFETTVVEMPTYLVAFVISEFESFGPEGGIDVWGRPEVVKNGYFARKAAIEQLRILEEFTGIEYPMLKVDLIGIPDFEMGAMENWGLITFREYGLFYKEGVTTSKYEKYLTTVIAHEFAHTWFGNLVTCQWWDYIWLNEGFAEYLEWYTADQMLPKDRFMDQFVVYELQAALAKDSSKSAHPMTNPVKTPKEIKGVFDYVTYGKSSSVLRMIFNAFDKEVHKSALRDYLKKHRGGTARPTDLWKSFKPYVTISIENGQLDFEEAMNTWTDQPGYPVVHASLNNSEVTLTQERFILDNKMKLSKKGTEFYWIPIRITKSTDNRTNDNYITLNNKAWLGPKPIKMYVNPMNEWFIVNYRQTGFYRVNYDDFSWGRLIEELQSSRYENIDVLNRAQIMDDLFYLTRAGYTDDKFWWAATKYLIREKEHLPWRAFFNSLSYVYERFEGQPHEDNLKKYVLNLTSETYDEVGFKDYYGEHLMDGLHREMILEWACKLDKPECVETSIDLFASWKKGKKKIPANAQAAVLCTAIRYGTQDDWEFLWESYVTSNFASQKMVYINALGCTRDPAVAYIYLMKIMNETGVDKNGPFIRRQDVSAVFTSVYGSSQVGINSTIHFLMSHSEWLSNYFGNWDDVRKLVTDAASHISDLRVFNKMSFLFVTQPDVFPLKFVKSIEDIVGNNLNWYRSHGEPFGNWIFKELRGKPGGCATIQPLNIILMTLVALISYFLSCH
ncbi:PREDICTED: uncharacterized protein LOC106743116 [Dinoponera quadriceps]|uniref:Aminopeptidase N n=1 Tax=Dinoponera quadriceps TaxID=609295 RepID=A0A6P3X1G2_DINQU|nr:PREDICTED: uncharacterized protein LOC106743116 [Dinoponera quadriceps]